MYCCRTRHCKWALGAECWSQVWRNRSKQCFHQTTGWRLLQYVVHTSWPSFYKVGSYGIRRHKWCAQTPQNSSISPQVGVRVTAKERVSLGLGEGVLCCCGTPLLYKQYGTLINRLVSRGRYCCKVRCCTYKQQRQVNRFCLVSHGECDIGRRARTRAYGLILERLFFL